MVISCRNRRASANLLLSLLNRSGKFFFVPFQPRRWSFARTKRSAFRSVVSWRSAL